MDRNGVKREPAGVAGLRNRIGRWRKSRAKPGPMPEELWRSAASLARKHGLNRIAVALGLEYYALKKRFDGAGLPRATSPVPKAPAFVEVHPAPATPAGCVLEIEEPGGRKLTVRSSSPRDVVAIAEGFWRAHR
jgi:hypothetical protein